MKSLSFCLIFAFVNVSFCVMMEECQILSNGDIFWNPKASSQRCPGAVRCPKGQKIHIEKIEKIRVCCCILEILTVCPDCAMAYANRMPFPYWFNVQMEKVNGPEDGLCSSDKVKRIMMEEGKPNNCCCEPRNSPFVPKEMRLRRN